MRFSFPSRLFPIRLKTNIFCNPATTAIRQKSKDNTRKSIPLIQSFVGGTSINDTIAKISDTQNTVSFFTKLITYFIAD